MSKKHYVHKACPLVVRAKSDVLQLLAFEHPHLDKQFVKGTIEAGELPEKAAHRELFEESGLRGTGSPLFIARTNKLPDADVWYFFLCKVLGDLPDTWDYPTLDDGGHTFRFFWHSIHNNLDDSWHPLFHEVFSYVKPKVLPVIKEDGSQYVQII